jgi:hypothetical protein
MSYQSDKNFIYFKFFDTEIFKFFFLNQIIIFFKKKKPKKSNKNMPAKINMNLLDNHTGNLVFSFKTRGKLFLLTIFTSWKFLSFFLYKKKFLFVFNLSMFFNNFLIVKYLSKKIFFGQLLVTNDKFKKKKKFKLIKTFFFSFLFIQTTPFGGKIWDFTSRRILHDIIFNETNKKALLFFGFLLKKVDLAFYKLKNKKKNFLKFIYEQKKLYLQFIFENKNFNYTGENSSVINIEKKKILKKTYAKPFSFIRIELDLTCRGFNSWKKFHQESWAAFEPEYQDIDMCTNNEKWGIFEKCESVV